MGAHQISPRKVGGALFLHAFQPMVGSQSPLKPRSTGKPKPALVLGGGSPILRHTHPRRVCRDSDTAGRFCIGDNLILDVPRNFSAEYANSAHFTLVRKLNEDEASASLLGVPCDSGLFLWAL